MTIIYGGIIITAITMLRFLFVVIWKSYRQMNDDLVAWMIVIQAGVIAILVNLSNIFRLSGQYAVSKQQKIKGMIYRMRAIETRSRL